MLASELHEKTVRRAMRLDPETDRMLLMLARRRGENLSVTLRDLIRQAAAERLQKIEVRPKGTGND